MHEGKISLLLGLKGMPALAEEIDAVRDIILAKETGAHIHIGRPSSRLLEVQQKPAAPARADGAKHG